MSAIADRAEIIAFCDELLDSDSFDDYGPNGLQVPGERSVRKLVTGVSAHLALIERAIGSGAQMLLAHHGLFWEFHPRALTEQMASRLRVALGAGLNVGGYHLPLDAHSEIGNNALLAADLRLEPDGRFATVRGHQIGVVASAPAPLSAGELSAALTTLMGQEPIVLGDGPERIERVGIVTGAGASYIGEAVALGLDALVTGEPAEHATADAREGGLHFVAAGHHATERAGIRALGERVADRFGVEHEFIEVPNPV
jgi:dinuclear metal center YbgI/SA1388 family protein